MTAHGERSITYQPALDGLRAVAVVLVLMFHLGLGWMSGGYLGVSVFFTLSGFLITSLLIAELDRSGSIRLGRFYGRRARRLLPASLVCLAGACVLIAARLVPDRSGLQWYLFGGLFQFANWVPLALHNSYGELFDTLSPTDHFWSLAIEEQFYWLWPLTMLGLFSAITRRQRRRTSVATSEDWVPAMLRALSGLYIAFAIAALLTAVLWSSDAAYFATWARVPEILAGAVLATFVVRHPLPRWTALLGPTAAAVLLTLAVVTPASHGFAYAGGLPLFALVSAGLIAGLQHPSPMTALLSRAPLVQLGRISYGVYLYHWPVFVVLTRQRTGMTVLPLSLVRVAVTLGLAVVSYTLLEQPIRARRLLPRPRVGLAATAIAVPLVVLLSITQVSNSSSFERTGPTLPTAADALAPLVDGSADAAPGTVAAPAAPAVTVPPRDPPEAAAVASGAGVPPTSGAVALAAVPLRPIRVLVIGDSTALATGAGLTAWAGRHPDLAVVEVQGFGGCGLLTRGDRLFRGDWLPESSGCIDLFDSKVPARVADARPDIVVVVSSFWDVTDHRSAADPTPRSVLDPAFRDEVLQRFSAYNQILLDAGAPRIAWVLYPATDYEWDAVDEPADDPHRFDAFHEVERMAAAPYPGRVSVLDLATWSDEHDLTSDRAARPDGVHWTADVAGDIAERWLGDQIVQAALH